MQLDLAPVRLPQDEAPHDVLAEWWYYTGHLFAGDTSAREVGFELVFFRGVRGDRPPGYAAHFAITDVARGVFRYDQRQDTALNETAKPAAGMSGSQRPPGIVSYGEPDGGFNLAMGQWSMRGKGGADVIVAEMPGYRLAATLRSQRPAALHSGEPPGQPGLISFGPAGYSYYYSRTRMALDGAFDVDGVPVRVHGTAWMDHQWGDFLVLGGGGWDWFALNFDDGRDLTVSLVRDTTGQVTLAYGTLVEAGGASQHLAPTAFAVTPTGTWTSLRTGVRYPAGWTVRLAEYGVDLLLTPLLVDQELDARASTGVVYWEGAVAVTEPGGRPVGRGYVELTGYTSR